MLDKNFDEIDFSDIQELIDNSVQESKLLEYKKELHLFKDEEKREFLADVSSFANTDGGILIYGMEEDKGAAKNIAGVQNDNFDALVRQMENIIRDGVEPRITIKTKTINVPGGDTRLILIRIEKSWYGPHRVIYRGHDKFYSRNSAGKYPLDTFELRNAFTSSSSLIEKIDQFRDRRIMEILNNNAPIRLPPTGKILLHFFPLGCFTTNTGEEFKRMIGFKNELGLLYWKHGYDYKNNLHGFLMYSPRSPDYTQVFRNGSVEALDGFLCAPHPEKFPDDTIVSTDLEKGIFDFFNNAMKYFVKANIAAPVFFSITLIHVKGYNLGVEHNFDIFGKINPIENDIIKLPETIINDCAIKPEAVLRPMFDMIWNACGYERSRNFNESGDFTIR